MQFQGVALFFCLGYLVTVGLEMPVLILGLRRRHSFWHRAQFGALLTALTYPVVVLILPDLIQVRFGRAAYLLVAEAFAPVVEVLAYRFIVNDRLGMGLDRDAVVIVFANLLSFVAGEAFVSQWIADMTGLSR